MNGKYQKIAKEYDIENEVNFLGYREDIPQLMKISNVAVSTAKQEGLPVNLIEAMMCNLPIIATDCRGNRDVLYRAKKIINNNEELISIIKEEHNKKSIVEEIEADKKIYEIINILQEMSKIYKTI